MKVFISKVIILLILINMFIPSFAFASSEYTIYNCDKIVNFQSSDSVTTLNNKVYLAIDSLKYINVEYYSAESSFTIYHMDKDIKACYESSIIVLNGTIMQYLNPIVKINNKPYVSFELIAMALSSVYEINNNEIHIWISNTNSIITQGTITLPAGAVAPVGGIDIVVFAGIPSYMAISSPGTSSSGGGSSSISHYSCGYKGIEKPAVPTSAGGEEYYFTFQRIVKIPEGKTSTDFFAEIPYSNWKEVYIGYSVCNDTYNESDSVRYYDFQDTIIRFQMTGKIKKAISGTVTLPQMTNENTNYTIIAKNANYTYTTKRIIKIGERTSAYSIDVLGDQKYNLSIVFDNGKYMRMDYGETLYMGSNYDISGVNFNPKNANKITGKLTLPDGLNITGEIFATITLQSADEPHYYLCRREVTIGNDNAANFELYDDMNSANAIVYYSISNYEGFYRYGHYSKIGTTSRVEYADKLTFDNAEITFQILKTKQITVAVKLPDNEVTDSSICGNIYAMPSFNKNTVSLLSVVGEESESLTAINTVNNNAELQTIPFRYKELINSSQPSTGGGGGGSVISGGVIIPPTPTIIESGGNSGTIAIDVIEEYGVSYKVYISNIRGNQKYYNSVYYKKNSSTVLPENATAITTNTNNLSITLMKQNIISGKIVTNCNTGFNIWAIYQKDLGIRDNIYSSSLVCKNYSIDDTNNYKIGIPKELSDYIIAFAPYNKDCTYYSDNGLTSGIKDAKLFNVSSDINNINIEYEGYNPSLPLEVTSVLHDIYPTNISINVKNISDFDKNSVKMNACLYDSNNKLFEVVSDKINIAANSECTFEMNLKKYYTDASIVKLLLWNDNMTPLANPYYIKNKIENVETQDINAVMKIGSKSIYINGNEYAIDTAPILSNGYMLAPLRALAETLNMTVLWNGDTQVATFVKNNNTMNISVSGGSADFNGEKVLLQVLPQIINGRTMIPAEDIAKCFGYKTVWTSNDGILKIENMYRDISACNKYYDAITQIGRREIMVGYEDGNFNPLNKITRAEFCVLACRMLGVTPKNINFSCSDVDSSHWGKNHIGYCINNQYMSLQNNMFRPNENLTVYETLSAVLNILGLDGNKSEGEIIKYSIENGLLKNIDKISTDSTICRDVLAQIIYNAINIKK